MAKKKKKPAIGYGVVVLKNGRLAYYDDEESPDELVIFDTHPMVSAHHAAFQKDHLSAYRVVSRAQVVRQATPEEEKRFLCEQANDSLLTKPDRGLAFVALNNVEYLPPLVAVASEIFGGPRLLRSYFENGDGDQWVAIAGDRMFGFAGSDVDWQEIVVRVTPEVTYKKLAGAVATMKNPLDTEGVHKVGFPKFWVMRESERLWLTSVLLEASDRHDTSLRPVEKAEG